MHFGQQQIKEMNQKDSEILHSAIVDKFSEIYYNIELTKTFLDQNKQLYYNENVNLISSDQEEKVYLETMQRLKKLVVSPNIIDSILLIGQDSNQRSLYYSSSTRKSDVESYPTWDVMQEVGLDDVIYQGFLCISRQDFIDKGEYASNPAIVNFCDYISDEYIYMDSTLGLPVVIKLNKEYLENIESTFGYAGIRIAEQDNIPRYQKYAESDDESYYNLSENFYGNLSIETHIKKENVSVGKQEIVKYLKGCISVYILGMVGSTLLLLFAASFISKRLRVFREIADKQKQVIRFVKFPYKKKNNVNMSKKIFIGICIPCVLGMIMVSVMYNKALENCLSTGIDVYMEHCLQKIAYRFEDIYDRYNGVSDETVEKLLISKEETNAFENDMFYIVPFLPEYSYSVVADHSKKAIYQTIFSGHLSESEVNIHAICAEIEALPDDSAFRLTTDYLSRQQCIAYIRKIYHDNSLCGYWITFFDFPEIASVMMETPFQIDCYLQGEKHCLSYGATQSRVKEATVSNKQNNNNYTCVEMKLCGGLGNLLAFGDVEAYFREVGERQKVSVLLLAILILLCALATTYLKTLLTRPLNIIAKKMKQTPREGYQQVGEHFQLDEVDEIVIAYNEMVDRLEEVVKTNINVEVEKKELELLQARTEFLMLQQQINPHFLFNTMENINQMAIRKGVREISNMVCDMSAILRYGLSRSELMSVRSEIEALKSYVNIQMFRHEGNKLKVEFDLDETLFECKIIKFILQPLVENAISHGVSVRQKGIIKISLSAMETGLLFRVEDNGVGMNEEQLSNIRNKLSGIKDSPQGDIGGIGVVNVYTRIKLYYGDEAGMEIDSVEDKGTKIELRIPFVL